MSDLNRDSPHQVPGDTTPAWESELLLSIGLVVAMLQLAPALDRQWLSVNNQLSEQWLIASLYGYLYLKSAVVGLIVTFVLQLTARGFWVALVGLRSVYPDGIDWPKLRQGPITERLARERNPSLSVAIERVDNAASRIFAFGFVIVGMSLIIMVLTVTLSALGAGLSWLFFDGRGVWEITIALMALMILPVPIANIADRQFANKIAPDGALAKGIAWVLKHFSRVYVLPWGEPLALTLGSRFGNQRMAWLVGLSVIALISWTALGILANAGRLDLVMGRFAGAKGGNTLAPAHYADQRRGNARFLPTPYIPSETIDGDSLKLFVPFHARRHGELFRARCPTADAKALDDAQAESARQQAILDCVATLFAVAINQSDVAAAWLYATDPNSRQSGFVTRLDVNTLSTGWQRVSIAIPDPPSHDASKAPTPPTVIPFWRSR
jgi:hypothetical protein